MIEKTWRPDLGNATDFGNNSIYGNTAYCVWNKSTCGTISARGNWWGAPGFPLCIKGSVDVQDPLDAPPLAADWPVEPVPSRPLVIRQAIPNPMSLETMIGLEVGRDPQRVSVRIYDVSGRLVRSFPEQEYGPGTHELRWDGRTDLGRLAPDGVYFFRFNGKDKSLGITKVLVVR